MSTRTGVSKKRKLAMASVSMAAVLAAARPNVLTKVFAAANTYEWTKQADLDRLGGQYTSAARSANGSALILGVAHGGEGSGQPSPLFISQNSGASWENVADEVDPGVQHMWTSVDVSNDGQTMVAASSDGWDIENPGFVAGKVFASENAGDTWSEITPEESDDWQGVVVSGDGSTIAAIEWGEDVVHLTEDNGENWTTSTFDEDAWHAKTISISDNGDKILVGGENSTDLYTHLYLTTNTGDTWANITPNDEDGLFDVRSDISADGSTIVTSTMGWADGGIDSVAISSSDGASWDEITPDDGVFTSWADVSVSDDASTLAVLDNENNKMYISDDLGANWTEEDPGQDYEDSNTWVAADMNEDGSKLVVVGEQNAYLSDFLVTPTVTLSDPEGGKTITLTTPAGTTITCHTAVKETGLAAQDPGYSYPLGLVDFCFSGADTSNEISLLFVTDLKPNQVVARKYSPTNSAYSTLTDATITETTYSGQHALLVSYTLVDNGPLDTDPDVGEIADPVGLGTTAVVTPNTGIASDDQNFSLAPILLLGGISTAIAIISSPSLRRAATKISAKK